ncbi:HEAT repeat domain-containing protein [Halomicronema sp. CCY15110]|uniref:HEAT repeat domain-containing protein n=1 Tax=Halomicronema sp. CCY15110 TaxID=2767773 RepID=UPI00194F94F3|nr:HEAT repeat domain-containing protein [Halomicronema sp. CCY15110]
MAKSRKLAALTAQLDAIRADPTSAAGVMALVLGESRLPEAFPVLRDWWQRTTHQELRQTGLLAIALLRREEAIQWLLQLLAAAPQREAAGALEALGLYQNDPTLWAQVRSRLASRPEL